MMRQSGLVGLFRIVFETVTDGYSRSRAWLVVSIMALVVAFPAIAFFGLLLLIAHLA